MQRSTALRVLLAGLAFAAVCGAPAQAAESSPAPPGASFLGMAVAAAVSENAQGLTDISGIQAAVHASGLPLTEDLQVYTRWSGAGTHTVGVQIRDASTGTVVGEASDELDFGTDPVTYYTHELRGTTFASAGTYLVQAALDGATVATYALFVNAEDQVTGWPAFVLSVPAERGWVDGRGSANLSGVFEFLSFPGFPATESFSIVTIWYSGSGSFDHTVRISDARGTVIAQSRHALMSAAGGRMCISDDAFHAIAFPSAGLYTATVFLNGYEVIRYPLVIRGR